MSAYDIFCENKEFSDLNPIHFGYEDCKKSHSYGPAIRTNWLIHFVVSGFGIFKIRNREYLVKPGEMFVIPPYVETYYEADRETPWQYIWIGFTASEKITPLFSDIIDCPEAGKIFQAMKNCTHFGSGQSAFLSARLWDLVATLSDPKHKQYDYVDNALEYIHSEYWKTLNVEEIAAYLNLNRNYFSVIFKKKIGISPQQYLCRYRMEIAASLLLHPYTSISVIANSVGYSDLYTFSRAFKRHFGISPTMYANLHKSPAESP